MEQGLMERLTSDTAFAARMQKQAEAFAKKQAKAWEGAVAQAAKRGVKIKPDSLRFDQAASDGLGKNVVTLVCACGCEVDRYTSDIHTFDGCKDCRKANSATKKEEKKQINALFIQARKAGALGKDGINFEMLAKAQAANTTPAAPTAPTEGETEEAQS